MWRTRDDKCFWELQGDVCSSDDQGGGGRYQDEV